MLPWALVAVQDSSTIDRHWLAIYPDSRIPAYPAAGLGFGFLANNRVFDGTGGGKWVGIAFDMKINLATMTMLYVSMPMDGTDLPDPTFNDAFPKDCTYFTTSNAPVDGYETCFAHYRKGFHDASSASGTYSTFGAAGAWKRYCVLYSEVGIPNWANTATQQALPSFDPTKLIKVEWDMYQPNDGTDPLGAPFDISLDNVRLITEAEAHDVSNNCDPTMIGQPPGTGGTG